MKPALSGILSVGLLASCALAQQQQQFFAENFNKSDLEVENETHSVW